MRDLILYIVKSLVDKPDDVEVRETEGEHGLVLELRVAPGDLGKVIGRQGRTIRAIRSVLGAASAKAGQRVLLEILDQKQ